MLGKILVALAFFLASSGLAHAEVIFTDNFDGQLDWRTVRNAAHHDPHSPCLTQSGKPEWKIVDDSIEMSINGSVPCSTEIIPVKPAGEKLRSYQVFVKMYVSETDMDRNLLLRWQNKDNHVLFHFFGSAVSVGKIIGGKPIALENDAKGYAFQPQRWYDVRMEYDLSVREIRLFINNVLVINAREPPSTSQLEWGKPGLAASVGAVRYSFVRFDDFRVESLENQLRLDVPLVKQTDPRWKDNEYDSAYEWAPTQPTIGRWGCALSSGVAVLQHYGIRQLENGLELNPKTLNDWLISQPDGYFPGGNINWRALSRLSFWHENRFGTPALEMTYENPTNKLNWLQQKIREHRPVILAQPGHFITAYGVGPGSADVAIRDPFYDRELLSAYQGTFDSARLFTPSHTDLSGITVLVPYWVSVEFVTPDGETKPATKIFEYPLQDPQQKNREAKPYAIYDLAKPKLPIVVKIATPFPFSPVWIAAYSAHGSVAQFTRSASTLTTTIEVDTTTETPSISSSTTLAPLRLSDLADLYSAQTLRHPTLVSLLLNSQSQLSSAADLHEALTIEKKLTQILQQATKNGWLDAFLESGLITQFRQQVLEKFP